MKPFLPMIQSITAYFLPAALLFLASCQANQKRVEDDRLTERYAPFLPDASMWRTVSKEEGIEVLSVSQGGATQELLTAMRLGSLAIDERKTIRIGQDTNVTAIAISFVPECIPMGDSAQSCDVFLCFENQSGAVLSPEASSQVSDRSLVECVRQCAKDTHTPAILPEDATVKRFGPLAKISFVLGHSVDDASDPWTSVVESWVDIQSGTVLTLEVGGTENR